LAAARLEDKWPVLGRHKRAAGWLRVWTDLGRAPRTIDAYARGLAEFLQVCEDHRIDPVTANRADVAVFVRELTGRPSRRGTTVVSIDSGCGLANATIQQRLVPVRLFFDFLVEEGVRESNPVGRGRYTPGREWGGQQRGLVPRVVKLPWIPTEQQWCEILAVAAVEPPLDAATLLILDSKFGKSRRPFLHDSTVTALRDYRRRRDLWFPDPDRGSFFVSTRGTRLDVHNLTRTFAGLLDDAGIAPPGRRRPRMHDLRHGFTVATLLDLYRDGGDIQARLPVLSTWLGHVDPKSTYWYLQAIPELLALAAGRLESTAFGEPS